MQTIEERNKCDKNGFRFFYVWNLAFAAYYFNIIWRVPPVGPDAHTTRKDSMRICSDIYCLLPPGRNLWLRQRFFFLFSPRTCLVTI